MTLEFGIKGKVSRSVPVYQRLLLTSHPKKASASLEIPLRDYNRLKMAFDSTAVKSIVGRVGAVVNWKEISDVERD